MNSSLCFCTWSRMPCNRTNNNTLTGSQWPTMTGSQWPTMTRFQWPTMTEFQCPTLTGSHSQWPTLTGYQLPTLTGSQSPTDWVIMTTMTGSQWPTLTRPQWLHCPSVACNGWVSSTHWMGLNDHTNCISIAHIDWVLMTHTDWVSMTHNDWVSMNTLSGSNEQQLVLLHRVQDAQAQ